MTIAEIYGKIPEIEGSEDLLTSDVFSAFRYLPPELAFIPFLSQAINFTKSSVISYSFNEITKVDYIFWPKTLFYKREPDLLILLSRQNKPPISIVVEVKYRSGKSNLDRNQSPEEFQDLAGDQLAEQYLELQKGNFKLGDTLRKQLTESEERFLLFITAHEALPKDITDETLEILIEKGFKKQDLDNLYWLNWQTVLKVINKILCEKIDIPQGYQLMLEDLKNLLEKKSLDSFSGFKNPMQINDKKFYFWKDEIL